MNAALYTDQPFEQQQISEALKRCGMECLHPTRVTTFSDYAVFRHALPSGCFDLLVIAQSGAFSLELIEAARELAPETPVFWFSDQDFAVRSYDYGVVWFGRKPVSPDALRLAFQRFLQKRAILNPMHASAAQND